MNLSFDFFKNNTHYYYTSTIIIRSHKWRISTNSAFYPFCPITVLKVLSQALSLHQTPNYSANTALSTIARNLASIETQAPKERIINREHINVDFTAHAGKMIPCNALSCAGMKKHDECRKT